MMGTSVAIFNRRAGGHFVKLTIFHYIPSDKNNSQPAHLTGCHGKQQSQLKDKTMNKYGVIFGVVMFAAGFFSLVLKEQMAFLNNWLEEGLVATCFSE